MKRPLPTLLILLALTLLAAGGYYYQQFPRILQESAQDYLQDYGVQQISYDRFSANHRQLSIPQLYLAGQYQGFAYSAKLLNVELGYDWRKTMLGQFDTLTVDSIAITLQKLKPSTEGNAISAVEVSSYLPKNLLSALPVEVLAMPQWALQYHSFSGDAVNLAGSFSWGKQLAMTVDGSALDISLRSRLWTEGETQLPRLELALSQEGNALGEAVLALGQEGNNEWHWDITARFVHESTLQWLRQQQQVGPGVIPDALSLAGHTDIDGSISHPTNLDLSQPLSSMQLELDINSHIERLQLPSVGTVAQTQLSARLVAGEDKNQLSIEPLSLDATLAVTELGLSEETRHWLRWKSPVKLRLRTTEPMLLTQTADKHWQFNLPLAELGIGNQDSQLSLSELLIVGEQSQAAATAISLATRMDTRLRSQELPQFKVSLDFEGSDVEGKASLSMADTAESIHMLASANGQFSLGQLDLDLDLQSPDLAYASESLLPVITRLKLSPGLDDLEISSGHLKLKSQASSTDYDLSSLKQSSSLSLDDVSGSYAEYRFEKLKLRGGWHGVDKWQTRKPIKISLNKLNVGFDIRNTQLSLSLPEATSILQPKVTLESYSSQVFGGTVVLPEAAPWDFSAPKNHLKLQAKDWRLADLVALQQSQSIEAHGVLEGELPVTFENERIIISGGYLRAIPPGGVIRYSADESGAALAATSPELKMAIDLLSDFQYEVLSTRVDLDPQGNLTLGLSLAGKNPQQQQGRPVNFNINLEQQLDPLLQSLRLSDKLVEQLESRGR
jgi:hypothetical protein